MSGAIDWSFLDAASGRPAHAGDLVSAEAGGLPIYRVVDLADAFARVRDLATGVERLAPLSTFHWLGTMRPR